jgi:predicted AAA+ superfamily ATPase
MKKAPRKVYVVDNGFVAAKAFSLSENLGRLLENQVFIELIRQGYDTEKTMFYYRSRNDKEVDFVLRKENRVERLVQVCYDLSSPKTEKREVDSIVECAGELKCSNLTIVTKEDERTIEKDGYTINVLPISKF